MGSLKEDKMAFETSDGVDVVPSFDALGLREDLLRGIYAYGTWWVASLSSLMELIDSR